MKYIVYITKNLVNNILYIGVHQTKDPEIFDGYIGCGVYINKPSSYAKPKTPFQYAVKKYGPKQFVRSIIKVFDIKEQAYELERKLVTDKEINSSNYYNCIIGGIVNEVTTKPIYQYTIGGKFIKEWNLHEAEDFYNIAHNSMSASIRYKQKLAGFYWAYIKQDQLDMKEYSNPNIPKQIYKYNKEGKCVEIYDSLHKFKNPGKVCTAIQTNKLYNGFYYSYTLFEKFIPKIISNKYKNIPIYIYDRNGKYFNKAIGVTETLKLIGGKSRSSLYNALNLNKPYKGFQFSLTQVDKLSPIVIKNEKKKVNVYDVYGNLLNTYDSVNQVITELHLDSSTVHRCLKGTARQTKGYILKYKQDS